MINQEIRWGMLGFVSTLLLVSVLLNILLVYKLYTPAIEGYLLEFRHPAPVTTADHVRGSENSQVTLIEYADFQCPFCMQLHGELKELSNQGKLRWVFREYPLPMHRFAERYAEACECAGRQGRFWKFADAIYSKRSLNGSLQNLKALADSLRLDTPVFQKCLESRAEQSLVEQSKHEGDSLMISGTPTFFINGKRYVGMMPLDQLTEIIAENAKKK